MTNVTTPVPDMTYYVFGGMLNLALSVYQCCQWSSLFSRWHTLYNFICENDSRCSLQFSCVLYV